MSKTLIIIRGVQGSGKSTLARLIIDGLEPRGLYPDPTSVHYEADMFFNGPDGYKWDGAKVGQAHYWCQGCVNAAMLNKIPNIIVSNTFVKKEEMKIYLEMAQQHGYQTQEIICKGRFQNVHGVSEERVEAKRRQFEY